MDEIIKKCRSIIENNINSELDKYSIDILTAAVLGIFLVEPKFVIERLPNILQNINIIMDYKSILEISKESLHNNYEDKLLELGDACVSRSLYIDDDGEVNEYRTLIISLSDIKSPSYLVSKTIHELVHLMRWGKLEVNGDLIIINDGISKNYYNIKTDSMRRKHMILEDGIVQRFTNTAISSLHEALNNCDLSNERFLEEVKNSTPCPEEAYYIPSIYLLDVLCSEIV